MLKKISLRCILRNSLMNNLHSVAQQFLGEFMQSISDDKVDIIAEVCHETNRAYCLAIDDHSHLPWDEVSIELKASTIMGVKYLISHPDANPKEMHDKWMEHKLANGWRYGLTKDVDNKVHPALLPYNELPKNERIKDYIFLTIVRNVLKLLAMS